MAFWNKKHENEPEQNPDGANPESTSREERKAKNPIKLWRRLVIALTMFVALLGITYGAISFTSTPTFCSTCHEMAPEHVTFQASAHNQIKCTQCHIEPGAKNLVVHKVESLKEVFYHIVGAPDPIVQTVAVSNENCEQCHSRNRLVTATGDIIVNHKGHIEEGIPCITCHSGVVHAKVVERGINDSESYPAWTKENADKLMGEKYEKPNMGTCIGCHDQVNQGKRPWKKIAYSLPENTHGKEDKKSVTLQETAETMASIDYREIPESTQRIILEAIGQQQTDVKLSMECFTCHQKINIPDNHKLKNWNQQHGKFAVEELAECLHCHQDSLWIKKLAKQDIRSLLVEKKKEEPIKQDLFTVIRKSRSNHFCSTCHANKPADHLVRYQWLYFKHPIGSNTVEGRRTCFVCHENEKPDEKELNLAPSDVYCEFCHEGEFTGEPFQ
jgi:nitrate/TMAO reductase-like tetraheme cytochrome c subunit